MAPGFRKSVLGIHGRNHYPIIMQRSSSFLDRHLAQTTMFPFNLEIERAEGIYLYTTDGRRYMDMISGVGVSALGHGHPDVKNAIKEQVDKHLHVMVYGEFMQSAQVDLADLLCKQLPESLNTVYFVNSGTEAVEAALKLVKRATGRSRLIAFQGAYHGSTHGSLSVSGNEKKKQAFLPLLPEVQIIPFNQTEALKNIDETVAGVIVETIQGDAGIRIPDQDWMLALRKRCDEVGALLILDEIQAGMGRAGTLFAFEQFGIVPDLLVLGKALGAGMPIGALISSRSLMELFTDNPMLGHITTFGGHPVVCASALAGLKVLLRDGLIEGVEAKGRMIREALESHPAVCEIRQRGLYMAIDLASIEATQQVVEDCLDNGLIGFWFLSNPASFRLAPPLTISEDELQLAISIIQKALDKVVAS